MGMDRYSHGAIAMDPMKLAAILAPILGHALQLSMYTIRVGQK